MRKDITEPASRKYFRNRDAAREQESVELGDCGKGGKNQPQRQLPIEALDLAFEAVTMATESSSEDYGPTTEKQNPKHLVDKLSQQLVQLEAQCTHLRSLLEHANLS